jgi:hypothetical protein
MSITVIVENDTIKLPVHVPDWTRLEITLPAESAAPLAHRHEWMRKYVGCIKDLPEDFAAEHDHYIHGTPKRSAGADAAMEGATVSGNR